MTRHFPRSSGALMGMAVAISALAVLPALAAPSMPSFHAAGLRIAGIAFAIGLDVLALSIGIGIAGIDAHTRVRVGFAFAGAEIFMQIVGAAIGAGAGRVAGTAAAYLGFTILAGIGVYMVYESFTAERTFAESATKGWGLIVACASISLDSLGVGFSLPALGVPLVPLFATVLVSTLVFTFAGLAFGAKLGERFRAGAERGAGLVLIALAIFFTLERLHGI